MQQQHKNETDDNDKWTLSKLQLLDVDLTMQKCIITQQIKFWSSVQETFYAFPAMYVDR